MQPKPYLFFAGTAKEAIATYAEIFGVDAPQMMLMSDMPPHPDMPIPEDKKDWVMHCELPIGDGAIMISDDITGESTAMAGSSVVVNYPTAAEGKAIFDKLSAGGEIRMDWTPTFWSAGFAMFTDRFGIRWMIGCDEPPAQ